MFDKLGKHLLLPSVIIMISLYIIGLRFWQNRAFTEYSSYYMPNNAAETVADEMSNEVQLKSDVSEKQININTATAEELQEIKGIGPKIAQRIVSHRESLGKYTTKEQLMQVKGIGEKFFENIKDYVTVE